MLGVSAALAKSPEHEVHVFTSTPKESVFQGVRYHPLQTFMPWARDQIVDVLISIRQWVPLVMPVRARYRVYLSQDAFDQPALRCAFSGRVNLGDEIVELPLFVPADFMSFVDRIFCVGHWQAKTFVNELGFAADKIHVTRNGIVPEKIISPPRDQRRPSLIYTSTPFRGLEHLTSIFPQIKTACPDAELDVLSGMQVYGVASLEDREQYGALYDKLKLSGAHVHGSLNQVELAGLLSQNRVFAYPNSFDETFCIAVLEAQAAGLPVVTSARAALLERVEHGVDGFLIEGNPAKKIYQDEFTRQVVHLLQDVDLWERCSKAARQKALHFSYAKLAGEWLDHFKTSGVLQREAKEGAWELFWNRPHYESPHPKKPGTLVHLDSRFIRQYLGQYEAQFGGGTEHVAS